MTNPTPLVKTIAAAELRQMIDQKTPFTLVEVMEPAKFTEFHLPGAVNIPLGDHFNMDAKAALLDKHAQIVVYCGEAACDASTQASKKLMDMGYTNVREFTDGKKGWREAADPAVRPASSPAPALAGV